MFFPFFRQWKELGEQPSLWAKLRLHYEEERGRKNPEEEEEEEEDSEEEEKEEEIQT